MRSSWNRFELVVRRLHYSRSTKVHGQLIGVGLAKEQKWLPDELLQVHVQPRTGFQRRPMSNAKVNRSYRHHSSPNPKNSLAFSRNSSIVKSPRSFPVPKSPDSLHSGK